MTLQIENELPTELRFGGELEPPSWDPASGDVEVWLDNRGLECAYGQVIDGSPWMHIKGIGDYRLERTGATAVPIEGTPRADVIDTYYRTVLPMGLQLEGYEVLHASAVVMPEGVVGLCAVSETGKSTLAHALERRGHPLFADDGLIFDIDVTGPRLWEAPFALRLRQQSAHFFGAPPREEVRIERGRSVVVSRQSLAAICVLERIGVEEEGGPVEVSRLSANEAFSATLPHAYCFTLRQKHRKAEMLRNYLSLVSATPVLRLRFRPGLENIDEIASALETRVGRPIP